MPLVRMVDRNELPLSTQEIFEAGEAKYGKVLDAWRVIAHNPAIFEAYLPFLQAVFTPAALDQRVKELTAVRVTLLNHCRYSLSHRVHSARQFGISEEDLVALVAPSDEHFSETELVALQLADELTTRVDDVSFQREPLGVSRATLDRAHELFTDAALVELITSVSLWNFLTRFLRVMDFDLDMAAPPPEMEAAL